MSDLLSDLEEQLREKEELIDALTDRLEQTAEQLDRLQRTVGDRGRFAPPAAGMPPELVDRQQTLCDDLQRAVQSWEETQPTDSLRRIESGMHELKSLVLRLADAPPRETLRSTAAVPREPAAAHHAPESAPIHSSWEAVKASLLGEEYIPPAGVPRKGEIRDEADPLATPLPEPPGGVDLDTAGREDLRRAVIARDEFITELLGRLRLAEVRTRPGDDWRRLESTPVELRGRLESLERRLEAALRTSEVELSLERARLGREAVRLRQLEEGAQKAMDRLNSALDETELHGPRDGRAEGNDTRWRRMLGLRRDRET